MYISDHVFHWYVLVTNGSSRWNGKVFWLRVIIMNLRQNLKKKEFAVHVSLETLIIIVVYFIDFHI